MFTDPSGKLTTDQLSALELLARQYLASREVVLKETVKQAQLLERAQHTLKTKPGRGGHFLRWLRSELGEDRRHAYNLIAVGKRFGIKADRKIDSTARFSLTALILLASPSVPKEAVQEACGLADAGTRVTAKRAKEIIKRHRGGGL